MSWSARPPGSRLPPRGRAASVEPRVNSSPNTSSTEESTTLDFSGCSMSSCPRSTSRTGSDATPAAGDGGVQRLRRANRGRFRRRGVVRPHRAHRRREDIGARCHPLRSLRRGSAPRETGGHRGGDPGSPRGEGPSRFHRGRRRVPGGQGGSARSQDREGDDRRGAAGDGRRGDRLGRLRCDRRDRGTSRAQLRPVLPVRAASPRRVRPVPTRQAR